MTKGDITKEKILAEAVRLVHKKGFEATSISDLIEATGLKKGCLYFHFASKDDLIMAILEKAKADFMVFLDAALSGRTPGDSLNNFFRAVVEFQKSCGFSGGCIFGNAALEMSDKDERITGFLKDLFAEWAERIKNVVKAAQAAGQVRPDMPSDLIARHIIMSVEGGIMLSRLEKSEEPLKNCINSLRLLSGLKK